MSHRRRKDKNSPGRELCRFFPLVFAHFPSVRLSCLISPDECQRRSRRRVAPQADLSGYTARQTCGAVATPMTNPGASCVMRGTHTPTHTEAAGFGTRLRAAAVTPPWLAAALTAALQLASHLIKREQRSQRLPQGHRQGYLPHLSPGSKGFCWRRRRSRPPPSGMTRNSSARSRKQRK